MTLQDRQLAEAALALCQAARYGQVTAAFGACKDHADLCIQVVTEYMEGLTDSGPNDPDALRAYVYSNLAIPTDDPQPTGDSNV